MLPRSPHTIQWFLFAPPLSSFQPNDLVFLLQPRSRLEKCHRKGRIESTDHGSKQARVALLPVPAMEKQDHHESPQQPVVVSVPLKRLIPIIYAGSSTAKMSVLVTADTNQYRNLAMSQIHENDDIVEIGCSTGETSVLLLASSFNANVSWVGLDTSAEMIQLCTKTLNQKLPADHGESIQRRHLYRVDALLHPQCAFQQATRWNDQGPTVVFIDIGGNRDCTSVLKIMAWCFEQFPRLRLAVIKNQELVRELRVSANTAGSLALDSASGRIHGGDEWFRLQIDSLLQSPLIAPEIRSLHPLRAPLVMSPVDGITPICRYHNYHPDGCKRRDDCLLDHEHCHRCRNPGHPAKDCNSR